MKVINSDKAPAAIGPYSQAIEHNGLIFVSGQLPIKDGQLKTDIEEATHACLQNIEYILEEAGTSMQNVLKVEIFIKNMSDFAKVNEIYSHYFTAPYPARACVEVSSLAKNAPIEIQCIACK